MRLQHIIQAVYCQPWAITREGWSAVSAIVRAHLEDAGRIPKAEADDVDFFGSPLPKMEVNEGVATIPVCGTLIPHASLFERQCGATGYNDISANLRTAARIPGLEKIVLDINSPGGACMGNQEVAGQVAELRERGVRVEAFTDTQMCSAAYNIAAGANQITATPSAMIGSIGTMMALLDESLAYEMEGLKRELFTSGPLKGTGVSGTSITEAQRKYLQGTVDHYAGMFKNHVRRHRPVDEETMQGQVFIGAQALDAGLVDELVGDSF